MVLSGSHLSFIAGGYPAHSTQMFMVESCNSLGCVNSTEASGTTFWDGEGHVIALDKFSIIISCHMSLKAYYIFTSG